MDSSGGVERLPSLPGLGHLGSPRKRRGRDADRFRRHLDDEEGGDGSPSVPADPPEDPTEDVRAKLNPNGSVIRRDPQDGSFHVDVVV